MAERTECRRRRQAERVGAAADLAAVVRGRRLDRGWSQSTLAQTASVSRQWLSALERGKSSVEVGLVLQVLEALDAELAVVDRHQPDWPGTLAPWRAPGEVRQPVDLDLLLEEHRG